MSQNLVILVPVALYFGLISLSFRYPALRSNQKLKYREKTIIAKVGVKYQAVNESLPPIDLLTIVFKRADESGDTMLEMDELAAYIHFRTKSHIEQALQENYGLFLSIDKSPQNGVISWDEYHNYFLLKNGLSEQYTKKHNERHRELGKSLKEAISRDKASWSEAAKSDPEFLTLDEFLAFRHPESSANNLLVLVDDLLDKLDRDGDEMLTEDEFSMVLPQGGDTLVSQGEEQRRLEFRKDIDKDKNQLADRKELLRYIDPQNPRHAREEAMTLVTLGDANGDGKLSLNEVLGKMDLFLGSKMIDTARSFHDEF